MRTKAYECPECKSHEAAEDSWIEASCTECKVRVRLGWYDDTGTGWRIVLGVVAEHPRTRALPIHRQQKPRRP